MPAIRARWLALLAPGLGLLVLAGVSLAVEVDLVEALRAFGAGAWGDGSRLAVGLLRAAPLLLAGLGVLLALRAGLLNLGAEGQLVMGALAAAWVGGAGGLADIPGAWCLALLAGGMAGALWGSLAGLLKALRGVPEILSCLLLTFIALELRSWLVLGPLRETARQYPQTDAIIEAAALPRPAGVSSALLLGCLLALAIHGLLARTRLGLGLRAVGDNPRAARAQGLPTGTAQALVLAASGALAGLAGAAEVLGPMRRVFEGYAPGHGYTAIAVAMLARLEPLLAVPSALFFGVLQAGAERMELLAQVPAAASLVVQAGVILAAVVLLRRPDGAR